MKRIPGRFHPGEYILEEMAARGWTIVEMCTCRMGTLEEQFDPKILGALLKGRHSVDKDIAEKLAKAFDMDWQEINTEFWLNLQSAYDEGGGNEKAV